MGMLEKLNRVIKNPRNILLYILNFRIFRLLPDHLFLSLRYRLQFCRPLNLNNPKTFNEKVQWLKLNWFDSLATKCADKYEVRNIVQDRIGKEYLNELYGVYDSVDEINLENLPNSFVLKATHGSKYNILCKDKTHINWNKEFKKMKKWMKINYYWKRREWIYKDIKPRIICEKFIGEGSKDVIMEYYIYCFNSQPKLIRVKHQMGNGRIIRNYYDTDWQFIDVRTRRSNDPNFIIPKPEYLDKILNLSVKLSQGFPLVRVDMYFAENRIIFGELTFFPFGGMGRFQPENFQYKLGSWWEMTELQE